MANIKKINQDNPQFGSAKPAHTGGQPECAVCEAMLADAQDGALSPDDQARFEAHLDSCTTCSQMLEDVRRGAAWLEMLRTPRPEPPAALLERILSQTSGQTSGVAGAPSLEALVSLPEQAASLPGFADPVARTATVLPFRSRMAAAERGGKMLGRAILQPRLAMTAAMAFFSIGLTLNLTGVQLNQLRPGDLKPSSLRRSLYQADAHMVRYYENLRVVYELESRVRDLQRSNESDAPAAPQPSEKKPANDPDEKTKPKQRQGAGTSRRQDGSNGSDGGLGPASFRLASAPVSPAFSLHSMLQEGELV